MGAAPLLPLSLSGGVRGFTDAPRYPGRLVLLQPPTGRRRKLASQPCGLAAASAPTHLFSPLGLGSSRFPALHHASRFTRQGRLSSKLPRCGVSALLLASHGWLPQPTALSLLGRRAAHPAQSDERYGSDKPRKAAARLARKDHGAAYFCVCGGTCPPLLFGALPVTLTQGRCLGSRGFGLGSPSSRAARVHTRASTGLAV